MEIIFDETNLLASMVGEEHGVTEAERREQFRRASEVVETFRKRVSESEKTREAGFPKLPFNREAARELQAFARRLRGRYDTVCVVGIGGSALGAWAIDCALRGPHPVQKPFSTQHPRLVILDNVDPLLVDAALQTMEPKKTVVLAISKEGNTVETMATLLAVRAWQGKHARGRLVAITGNDNGELNELARRENWPVFRIPEDVGGRFSVLTAVGLLPAALIGADVNKMLAGAAEMTEICWRRDPERNPALRAALLHHVLWQKKGKNIHVAFPYTNRLWGTAFWFRQLWAESLGKAISREGERVQVGQTPVAALGATDQHSQLQLYVEGPNDKVFTFWALKRYQREGRLPKKRSNLPTLDCLAGKKLAELVEIERMATEATLTLANRPNCAFWIERVDETHLGAFFQLLEFQTAFMGELLGVNAFDQPGVVLCKELIRASLDWPELAEKRHVLEQYHRRRQKVRA